MKGPDIAKKFVGGSTGFALASQAQKRWVFVVPIIDILLGFSIDRTSSANENVLRPFAFPLAFGSSHVFLDSTFPAHTTRFNPQSKDCLEQVQELVKRHVAPWLRARQTLESLLASTPMPEKGYDYNMDVYKHVHGTAVIDYVKLLCLVDRVGEARALTEAVEEDVEKYGVEKSVGEGSYRELLSLRSAIIDAKASARREFWSNARETSLKKLQIAPTFLAKAP